MSIKRRLLLCGAAFLAVCAVSLALMYLLPNGALNPCSPDRAMEELTGRTNARYWASAVRRSGIAPESTPFEDALFYRDAALDALTGGELTFSRIKSERGEPPAYDIFSDGTRLCSLTLRKQETGWTAGELIAGPMIDTKTLTVAVPAGAVVTINGVTPGDTYFSPDAVPYEALTEAESAFAEPPLRKVCTVTGLYDGVTVTATREGRPLTPEPSALYDMAFTDSLSLTVYAPKGAEVAIGGAPASPTGEGLPYSTLALPEGVEPELYDAYTLEGLRDIPAVSAAKRGAALSSVTAVNGERVFLPVVNGRASAEYAEVATTFLESYAKLATGRIRVPALKALILPDTGLYRYIDRATPGLIWVHSITLTMGDIDCTGFIPLGDDLFMCEARMDCRTKTFFEERELSLDYELMFVRRDGVWLAADMSCR